MPITLTPESGKHIFNNLHLTPKEVAKQYGLNYDTVRELMKKAKAGLSYEQWREDYIARYRARFYKGKSLEELEALNLPKTVMDDLCAKLKIKRKNGKFEKFKPFAIANSTKYTAYEMAEMFGIDSSTVRLWLRNLGLKYKYKIPENKTRPFVLANHETMTAFEIAKALGMCKDTILKCARSLGVKCKESNEVRTVRKRKLIQRKEYSPRKKRKNKLRKDTSFLFGERGYEPTSVKTSFAGKMEVPLGYFRMYIYVDKDATPEQIQRARIARLQKLGVAV